MENNFKWDIFLSHASEEKDEFVRPLAQRLLDNDIKAWYDEFEINWGDSLRESIDSGLKNSKFAIVVLSKNYFKKSWTSNELNGYFTFDSPDAKRILPIWYKVTREEVQQYSPILADRLGIDPRDGIDGIVTKVKKRLNLSLAKENTFSRPAPSLMHEEISWDSLSRYTTMKFGVLGIDQYWQAQLLDDIVGSSVFKTVADINRVVDRAIIAVALCARDNPSSFKTGTDFITKAIGLVDPIFRQSHGFSARTLALFDKYNTLIQGT